MLHFCLFIATHNEDVSNKVKYIFSYIQKQIFGVLSLKRNKIVVLYNFVLIKYRNIMSIQLKFSPPSCLNLRLSGVTIYMFLILI